MKHLKSFSVLLFLFSLNKYICVVKIFGFSSSFEVIETKCVMQKAMLFSNSIEDFLHKLGLVGAAATGSRVAAFLFMLFPFPFKN